MCFSLTLTIFSRRNESMFPQHLSRKQLVGTVIKLLTAGCYRDTKQRLENPTPELKINIYFIYSLIYYDLYKIHKQQNILSNQVAYMCHIDSTVGCSSLAFYQQMNGRLHSQSFQVVCHLNEQYVLLQPVSCLQFEIHTQ